MNRFSIVVVGVLILDHVPKRRQERPRGAIGSQHKLAKIDGAAMGISGKPWTKTQDGAMVLRLEKDRQGDIPGSVGAKVATIKGWYEGATLHTSIVAPDDADGQDVDLGMTLLIAIADAGPDGITGAKNLYATVKGKTQAKSQAALELIQ